MHLLSFARVIYSRPCRRH